MYLSTNPKSKAAAKRELAAGIIATVFQPGGIFHTEGISDGEHAVEGPHFPEAHRWYGVATVKDQKLVSLR